MRLEKHTVTRSEMTCYAQETEFMVYDCIPESVTNGQA